MDSAEFSQWIEFFTQIEVFPSDRAALGHAVTACTITAANRRKGAPPPRPEQFLIQRREPQSEGSIAQAFKAFADAVAKKRRKPKRS